jgi:hypothetical protein
LINAINIDFAAASSKDVPFPIDCTKEQGFAWTQPATYFKNYTGVIKTSEGLCIDAVKGRGQLLQANTCVTGSTSQNWTIIAQGAGFNARVAGTNLCMDVFGQSTAIGSAVGVCIIK